MRLLLFIIAIIVSLPAFSQTKLVKQARVELESKDLTSAIKTINQALLGESANDAEAWELKGDIYAILMKSSPSHLVGETGFKAYEKAVELGGNVVKQRIIENCQIIAEKAVNESAKRSLADEFTDGLNLMLLGDQIYTFIGKASGENCAKIAQAAVRFGRSEIAERYVLKALADGNLTAEAHITIDQVYHYGEKPIEERKANLVAGLEKFPDDLKLLLQMIKLCLNNGLDDMALEYLPRAVVLDPKNESLLINAASFYERKFAAAMRENDDVNAEIHFNMAKETYQRVFEFNEGSLAAKYGMGSLYIARSNAQAQHAMREEDSTQAADLIKKAKADNELALPFMRDVYDASSDEAVKNALMTIYISLDMVEEYLKLKGTE